MNPLSLFGERSLTLVAASFDSHGAAERAAYALKQSTGLDGEVAVIDPGDPLARRKLEPEQRGLWTTLLRSHLILGVAGVAVGVGVGVGASAAGADVAPLKLVGRPVPVRVPSVVRLPFVVLI